MQTQSHIAACTHQQKSQDDTCAAKSLNGIKFALLHANPLLPAPHIGHALVAMYLVLIDLMTIQPPNDLDLHINNHMYNATHRRQQVMSSRYLMQRGKQ